ncbi:MAG: ABC-2 family transporter protein [Chloroflexota bacterium]
MHYLRLIWTYLRLSALNELQYRANLLLQLFNSVLGLGIGLAGLALVFYHTDSLAGWGPLELLVVVGVHTLIGGVVRSVIQPNMYQIAEGVQEGTLDYILTKPEDSQLLVSFTRVELWKLVDVVIGLGVLTYAVIRLGENIALGEAAAFAILLLAGGLIFYSFWLAIATTSFWVVRTWAMYDMFDRLYQAGRWPVGIYPAWLRLGLTFLVPVAFAVTVPAEALTGRLSPLTLVLALGMSALAIVAARWFWHFGLRHYSGASA